MPLHKRRQLAHIASHPERDRRCMRFLLNCLIAIVFAAASASAQPVNGGHATAELIADHSGVAPGQTIYAALKLKMQPGWHVYWRNAGDAGLPPELAVQDGSGFPAEALGAFVWPIPHLLPVVPGEIMDYGYDDEVVLPFALTVPQTASGEISLRAVADYLICQDICIPEAAAVALTLTVGTPLENQISGETIGNWTARAPTDWPGEVRLDTRSEPWALSLAGPVAGATALRFFPFNHEIRHSADQPVSLGPAGATLRLTPAAPADGKPLEGVVVVETAGGKRAGYTISAAPGAPLAGTSGTPLGGGAAPANTNGAGPRASLLALLFFAFVGGLVLNLMPCVLPVLSMKAISMVQAAASGQASEVRAHGIWYTVGVLAAFAVLAAATLAVRAATGSATLGFQLQHAPTVAVLALIMFAIGLWLMGFFELGTSIQNTGGQLADQRGAAGAFFTGLLAAVVGAPCVGPFLGAALGAVMGEPAPTVIAAFLFMGFGLALPFLLLSFVPGLQRRLPKPGRWMETLKQVFAFPMFLTMAWLLSVLGALAGSGAAAWTVAGAIAIAFAIWLGRRGGLARIPALGILVFGFGIAAVSAAQPAPAPGAPAAYAAKYPAEAWSEARVSSLVAEGRPVFVDFTAAWCATCQVNKSTTLKSPRVQAALKTANAAFLVADFTRKDPAIAAALKAHRRAGVPLYLWYPAGVSTPQILPEILTPDLVIGVVAP
jgi:thiol:disulfide interchange protein/DsbC/DsbD-like thiol-disulfide interchange protein